MSLSISGRLIVLFICLFIGLKSSQGQCDVVTTPVVPVSDIPCNTDPWILVFEDNFDGDSLDLVKWKPIEGVPRDPYHELEKQWYQPSNIEISNGTLKLVARKESSPLIKEYTIDGVTIRESFDYTSGEINSRQSFNQGIFEIRCKIPKGKGFWPAFWLWGNWPTGISGEIDVFEFWNQHDIWGSFDLEKSVRGQATNLGWPAGEVTCPKRFFGPDYSADFHVFKLIWDAFRIEWHVDGALIRRWMRYYSPSGEEAHCPIMAWSQYIRNDYYPPYPLHIYADLALRSLKEKPNNETPFPSSYEIDYIRCWQQIPVVSVKEFKQNSMQARIYPNPGNGMFNIDIEQDLNQVEILIYDQVGKLLIKEKQAKGSEFSIDLSKLNQGVYFLRVLNVENGEAVTQKLIRQ